MGGMGGAGGKMDAGEFCRNFGSAWVNGIYHVALAQLTMDPNFSMIFVTIELPLNHIKSLSQGLNHH